MDVIHTAGALILSLFVLANIYAMYAYLRRHLSLAASSEMNHAIAGRFDSEQEIEAYHVQIDAKTHAKANAALATYRQIFMKQRNKLDPSIATRYPTPSKSFEQLLNLE